jgi:hypothetical protein
MRLTLLRQLQTVFGTWGTSGHAAVPTPGERPAPICLQRARLALSQLQSTPECLLVAERIQQARRLLKIAEQWAARPTSADDDADEMADYYSCLSERHAQEAADLILRSRCITRDRIGSDAPELDEIGAPQAIEA